MTFPQVFVEVLIKSAKRYLAVDKEHKAKQTENRARKRQRPLSADPPTTNFSYKGKLTFYK